jgi:predicted secreted protein
MKKSLQPNHLYALSLLFLLLTTSSQAIYAAEKNTYNRVSYNVTEQMEVNNDEVTIVMSADRDGQDATKLANEINKILTTANTTIKKFTKVKSSTSDYSIRPVYNSGKRLDHWRGAASILLKSTDIKAMVGLVQELQSTLRIKSTRYNVSAERKDKLETGMIDAALEKFNQRATLVSNSMGFKKYRLVNVNINNTGRAPRPVYAMQASSLAKTSNSAPVFESGQSTLKITVSGTIEMEVTP